MKSGWLTFQVPVTTTRYEDYWVTVVEGLPIAAHGDSEQEADRRADDLLTAFLGYKDHKGVLRDYLKSRGIQYSEDDSRSYGRIVSVPVG